MARIVISEEEAGWTVDFFTGGDSREGVLQYKHDGGRRSKLQCMADLFHQILETYDLCLNFALDTNLFIQLEAADDDG